MSVELLKKQLDESSDDINWAGADAVKLEKLEVHYWRL